MARRTGRPEKKSLKRKDQEELDAELSERNVSKKAHREAKQAEISQQ
jgi:hypothetical protein